MNKKRILLITNRSDTVINFRKELILFLLERGNDVFVISGDNEREDEIKKLGVGFILIPFSNRSKNPFKFQKTKRLFTKTINVLKPDIVFTFQIKPNILGPICAKKAQIENVFSMVEGLGDPFQPKTLIDRMVLKIIVRLYKKSLKNVKKVFFLNNDDCKEFVDRKIVPYDKCIIVNGIGIDTDKFIPLTDKCDQNNVLMISRLLVNKGIFEYCEIAHIVRQTRPDIHFYLYGEESQLTISDIKKYIDNGDIIYGGKVNNVIPIYFNSKIYVSTSHREGFPRTILEAMALGKPVLASNVVGNKAAVIDGCTGQLIDLNVDAFADNIIRCIDNEEKLKEYGETARKVCVERYNSKIINEIIVDTIDECIK